MKVCIDPGHGGKDPGATSPPLIEKKLNLVLANVIAEYLRRNGHEVGLIRTDDIYVRNRKRAQLANDWKADVFISVHHNSYHLASANGFEVLHYPTSRKGRKLATSLCNLVTARWPIRNRGPKPRKNLTVLFATRMPAILIEAGFVSSTVDRKDTLLHKNTRAKFHRVTAKSVAEILK